MVISKFIRQLIMEINFRRMGGGGGRDVEALATDSWMNNTANFVLRMIILLLYEAGFI